MSGFEKPPQSVPNVEKGEAALQKLGASRVRVLPAVTLFWYNTRMGSDGKTLNTKGYRK